MNEEMSFKCLLDVPIWAALLRDVFKKPVKSQRWIIFAKINNNF